MVKAYVFQEEELIEKLKNKNLMVFQDIYDSRKVYIDTETVSIITEHFLVENSGGSLSRVFSNKSKLYDMVQTAIDKSDDLSEELSDKIKSGSVVVLPASSVMKRIMGR